jgi:predicted Fe-S protein YdhL (DUF1289 family)
MSDTIVHTRTAAPLVCEAGHGEWHNQPFCWGCGRRNAERRRRGERATRERARVLALMDRQAYPASSTVRTRSIASGFAVR